jgi:putative endonuclease
MVHFVCILRCADGTFYVGSARDVNARVKAHNDGRAAAHTFERRPVRIAYTETFDSKLAAIKREQQPKRWSHEKKQALIDGNFEELTRLSKSRSSLKSRKP